MLQVYIESGEETLDPVHPNISTHILIAVLYKFSEVLTQSRCSHNQGAKQSRASFIGDNFHYSHDLYTWLNCGNIGRNSMLVTLRDQSAKKVIL